MTLVMILIYSEMYRRCRDRRACLDICYPDLMFLELMFHIQIRKFDSKMCGTNSFIVFPVLVPYVSRIILYLFMCYISFFFVVYLFVLPVSVLLVSVLRLASTRSPLRDTSRIFVSCFSMYGFFAALLWEFVSSQYTVGKLSGFYVYFSSYFLVLVFG